jgi:DHA1 family tetracycline resistance protein-like MFS transporter
MLRSPLLAIFLTVFVDVLALTIAIPLLPYYAKHFGASPLVIGVLGASFAACSLLSGPLLGRLSDRFGRRPVLLVSQLGTLIGFLVLGFAQNLAMLFVGRMLDGVTAGNLVVAQAYISDVTKPENRTKAFGLIGISFGVGFMVGPALSGWLAKRYGFAAPAFAAAGLSLSSVLATALLLPPTKAHEGPPTRGAPRGFSSYLSDARTRPVLLAFGGFLFSFSIVNGGLALFLGEKLRLDVGQTGLVYAFSGLVGALLQGPVLGKLAARLGEGRLVQLGLGAVALGYSLLGLVESVRPLLFVVAMSSLGVAVVRPAATTLLTKAVHVSEQGAVLGVSQSLGAMSAVVGPLLAGALIDRRLFAAYGAAAAAFAAAGLLAARGIASHARAGEGPPSSSASSSGGSSGPSDDARAPRAPTSTLRRAEPRAEDGAR